MNLDAHGESKYVTGDLLQSALSCNWPGIAAELRRHPAGELPPFDLAQTEIGIATSCDPNSVVTRRGNGLWQRTRVAPGVIWTCPAGVREEDIAISAWHECLHIYLPPMRFIQLSEIRGGPAVEAHHVRYLAGVHDALFREIAWTLIAEMRDPTSAGRMLVDTLALALTARLAQAYASEPPRRPDGQTRHALDEARLGRVVEYMAEHIEEQIGLDDLAAVACLSPFHFIRMFRKRMGVTPSRYLGQMRLERAKSLLALGDASLSEIALVCCFSSQANFSRAFRRATGMTPGSYRGTLS